MRYFLEKIFCFNNDEIDIAIIAVDEEGFKTAYSVTIDEHGDYILGDAVEGLSQDSLDIEFLEEVKNVF